MGTTISAETATPQAITPGELDRARLFLEQARDAVVGSFKSLTPAQWSFQPAQGRWSVAQIVEHIIFVQGLVLGPIRERLVGAPPAPASQDYRVVDAIVIHQFPNRLSKFAAPPVTHPAGRLARAEALDQFRANHDRLVEHLESSPGLRANAVESLPLKAISDGAYETMDGYQWILAAAAHTERHAKQILEVIADPSFPEK
jgi:hypothetical protein